MPRLSGVQAHAGVGLVVRHSDGEVKVGQKLLLVDYENVQQIDFCRLGDSFNVVVFLGSSQKTLPVDLVSRAQPLGKRLTWQPIDGNGSNALDFYIACHLGRLIETTPNVDCIVLSKDKGFDPLLRHMNQEGLKCRRINSLLELEPGTATAKELQLRAGPRSATQVAQERAAPKAGNAVKAHRLDDAS